MTWKTGCILYGSNTDTAAGAMPLKATVAALSGVVIETLNILGTYSGLAYMDELLEYSGDYSLSAHKPYQTFNMKLKPKDFPSSDMTIETMYLQDVLSKRFHWLYFDDFPLRPNDPDTALPIANTKVLAISIYPTENAPETSRKAITIKFRAKYG
ncbi:MAG: hypothetical protein KJ915_03090 [Candidatus Omnitrophica bacterium]|nr:hypothetical protein [Candidatus Omnitrophota bacterium]